MQKEEVSRDFHRILDQRPDTGPGKIVSVWLFEPPNPFDPAGRRKPKPEAIVLLAYAALMIAACAAFNAT
jgi:hypothetical protein